jgi:tetratricopeptide (TPR) repeat protein
VGRYVKPGINNVDGKEDKNVMPYELEDFAETQAGLQAVVRVGGEAETLKRLLAAGFPVIVEKGYYERDYTGKLGWLGHYQFVTGYDDPGGYFIVQDTYLETGENGTGANMQWDYADFVNNWRSFNYLFIVVYPEAMRAQVIEALGQWNDEEWANQHALEIAQAETETLTGNDQFFAWFNVGSNHVRLQQYVDAAFAYDFAFQLYEGLGGDETSRPYRIMWYQTGPYFAYYYSGRYRDTVSLATTTLIETIEDPTLEESLYWRGLAYEALGEMDNAVADYRETVRLNPNFEPGWAQLERLGLGS